MFGSALEMAWPPVSVGPDLVLGHLKLLLDRLCSPSEARTLKDQSRADLTQQTVFQPLSSKKYGGHGPPDPLLRDTPV